MQAKSQFNQSMTVMLDRFWDAANDVSLQYKILMVTQAGCKPQADSLRVMSVLVACHRYSTSLPIYTSGERIISLVILYVKLWHTKSQAISCVHSLWAFAVCWATVCKTIRPVLSDRCLSCPSVTLVYCGQTAGWIKTPHGTEVGFGPGEVVLHGVPALHPPQKTGHSPQFSAHVCCGQTVAHLSYC